jgi:hypothetical protein
LLTDVRYWWNLGNLAPGTSPVPQAHVPPWVSFHVRDFWVSPGRPYMKLGQSQKIYQSQSTLRHWAPPLVTAA